MQAGAVQPIAVSRDRRIIERPRLMKLLDDTDARTILLLAPAGYGKTTLARQWARTLQLSVWIGLTPRHQDIAWLAEDLAREGDRVSSGSFAAIREHINARSNPQKAARELGKAMAECLRELGAQWLIVDDYHEIDASLAADDFMRTVVELTNVRQLVTSRTRPKWATGRMAVYGAIGEIGRDELAMTDAEAHELLERSTIRVGRIAKQARGWPAVIGLAATVNASTAPDNALPEALHRYLAEELFHRAQPALQEHLVTLALMGDLSDRALHTQFGSHAGRIEREARDLGFSSGDQRFELHPLLREFLLERLLHDPNSDERVRRAVEGNLDVEAWDRALELILRFKMLDCVEEALQRAYKPLVRSGRLATLVAFAQAIATAPTFPPASCDVALAEAALRDGHLELARDLATRAQQELARDHPLTSRCAAIIGQVAFLLAEFSAAENAYRLAHETARDERDEAEALHGLAQASVFGERPGARQSVSDLASCRDRSPTAFLRFATVNLAHRRLGGDPEGLSGNLFLDTALETLPQVEDPRVRTAMCYAAAGALTQRTDYRLALDWLSRLMSDATRFDLEFVMPYANWTAAQIALGQRRFGEAERALQAVEDAALASEARHHALNARTLRARLLLQTGQVEAALANLRRAPECPLIPSWRAEYIATKAIALACAGKATESAKEAELAEHGTLALEVRMLAQVARSIASVDRDVEPSRQLMELAAKTNIWDPVLCGVRASQPLADALAADTATRETLEELYRRSGDLGLARRAGFRTRSKERPHEVLSPREMEVLGLIARGYRNNDIAKALFIAQSTTKVHVRHILEKLGVRTRSEAVARFQMFSER